MIKYRKDADNIVTLTLNMQGQLGNIINHHIGQIFIPVIEQLQEALREKKLTGVIITSSKKTFLTGGELDYLYTATDKNALFETVQSYKKIYRQLETLGVPIVAAINGSALGSGFELALACHYRIAIDNPKTFIGMPEVKLGLMPSSGGLVRLIWKLGLKKAFPIAVEGRFYRPFTALEKGLIDALAKDNTDLICKAKTWILAQSQAVQVWDLPKTKLTGGTPRLPEITYWIAKNTIQLVKKTQNNYPAPLAILKTMVDIASVDFDTGYQIESRQFVHLVMGQNFKNMAKAYWYDINSIKQNKNRPKGFGKFRPQTVGIIGAGRMGSAIAYLCAVNDMKVIIKDVSKIVAERGRRYSETLLKKEVKEGRLIETERKVILKRIQATDKFEDFEVCDVVIEAVFENLNLKKRVIEEASKYLDEFTLFATNTSSLSISRIAKASIRPENFIGMRFFTPVEQQKMVEIISGTDTSDETIARAYDFAKKIHKIPIVVHDRRGFYTSRVSSMYALEGLALLNDGVSPLMIERFGVKGGMHEGPLAMLDDMSISQTLKYERIKNNKIGLQYFYKNELSILDKMVNKFERTGKYSQKGFYDYAHNNTPTLWRDLNQHFKTKNHQIEEKDIVERLMFVQVLEAVRCFEEGTIMSVPDANIGSIYGWGFAPFKGGVLQYINDYGLSKFIERATELAKKYGTQFTVPPLLYAMEKDGRVF